MLEGYVQIGKQLALGHQRNQFVNAGIRIDVMQAHPDAEFGQRLAQLLQARLDRAAAPEAHAVLEVNAIGGSVLRDDEDFLDPGFGQVLCFLQHVADRPTDQRAAHRRDDAEGAAVVAAFGNLDVSVVLRRQADTLRRHQAGKRIVRLRQMGVHVVHHLVGGMRAGDGQHRRMRVLDDIALGAKAASDNDPAVFVQRLANRIQRFLHGGVDETAGIDHHQIGPFVGTRDQVALGAQAREDLLGIGSGLWTAKRNKADSCRLGG